MRICPECGNEFRPKITEVRRGHGIYCSIPCRRKHQEKAAVGYLKKGLKSVHRIVAEQSIGRPLLSSEIVHHRDGNKKNNDPSNLEVISSKADHHRLHASRGEESEFAKLTWELVRHIRQRRAAGESVASLAAEFGVDPSNIRLIVRGKTWVENESPHCLRERTLFD